VARNSTKGAKARTEVIGSHYMRVATEQEWRARLATLTPRTPRTIAADRRAEFDDVCGDRIARTAVRGQVARVGEG